MTLLTATITKIMRPIKPMRSYHRTLNPLFFVPIFSILSWSSSSEFILVII